MPYAIVNPQGVGSWRCDCSESGLHASLLASDAAWRSRGRSCSGCPASGAASARIVSRAASLSSSSGCAAASNNRGTSCDRGVGEALAQVPFYSVCGSWSAHVGSALRVWIKYNLRTCFCVVHPSGICAAAAAMHFSTKHAS